MTCEKKVEEYLDIIDSKKIIIETQFANIEQILKNNDSLSYDKVLTLLNNFNTNMIKYEQICDDLTEFLKIFKTKEEQEFRVYKTEELIDLLEKAVNKVQP